MQVVEAQVVGVLLELLELAVQEAVVLVLMMGLTLQTVQQIQAVEVEALENLLALLTVVLAQAVLVLLLFDILVTNIQPVVPQILQVDTQYIPLQVMAHLILRHILSINEKINEY
jgi:hypothetical protein